MNDMMNRDDAERIRADEDEGAAIARQRNLVQHYVAGRVDYAEARLREYFPDHEFYVVNRLVRIRPCAPAEG